MQHQNLRKVGRHKKKQSNGMNGKPKPIVMHLETFPIKVHRVFSVAAILGPTFHHQRLLELFDATKTEIEIFVMVYFRVACVATSIEPNV